MRVAPGWCEDHRTTILGVCPFCRDGLEPVRYLEARTDFRGVPLAGTLDLLPHQATVLYSDVVHTLGQQLADLERMQAAAVKPFNDRKAQIFRQMRAMHLDPTPFSRAVRVYLGHVNPRTFKEDEIVQLCLQALRDGKLS